MTGGLEGRRRLDHPGDFQLAADAIRQNGDALLAYLWDKALDSVDENLSRGNIQGNIGEVKEDVINQRAALRHF